MAPGATSHAAFRARLRPRAPFDSAALLEFLRKRAVSGLEVVGDSTYARTLRLARGPAWFRVEVTPVGVDVDARLSDPGDATALLERVRWLLDLEVEPGEVENVLERDPALAASLRRHPGLRVPGHVDGFEVAVRAIVGQQISVVGARTILGRLVAELGEPLPDGADGLDRLFPDPPAVAGADPGGLPMPRSRGQALVTLAAAVAAGDLVLDRTADLLDVRRDLLALPGIGPWTADYIALRALGDPDVFMATDLGVRHGLARLGIAGDPERQSRWAPWRSYALMHVWAALG